MVDAAAMHSPSFHSAPAMAVRRVLETPMDAHRRQRELIRASLVLCPDKPRPAAKRH